MKKLFPLLLIIIMLFSILSLSGCNEQNSNTDESNNDSLDDGSDDSESFDPPILENIGINIDYYNATTNKAGDFQFDAFIYPWGEGIYNEKVFYDYGFIETNEDGTTNPGPQPIFVAPLGTKVHAITSGVVHDIHVLYSDDYTIRVVKEDNPNWLYEHEHVINISVSIGDRVTAGQEIAEVSDYINWLKNDGYGLFDIGLLTTDENGNPWHHCPFMYLNESVKQDYYDKINALYKSWEEYTGNYSLYNEDEYCITGCVICDPIND